MSQVIAYDVCRLFIGPYFATPRGIDRVDLAVANHLFADPDGPHLAILPTPFGVRAYPARTARLLLDRLHGLWREESRGADETPLRGLVASMHSPISARAAELLGAPHLSRWQSVARMLALVRHIGISPGRSAERAVPAGAVYVNLGQLALAVPMFFRWLHRRPDVACALMIHDTIPLDHVALVKPAAVAHHARMIRTAATYADGLIFSTAFAQASVNAVLARAHIDPLPSLVRSLPVPAAFAAACQPLPALADRRYFVVVSTIEPRKNYGLLLRVWQSLIDRMGAAAPHLVMVGAPGLEAERILAPLAASATLRERVHQVSGLSSPTLARLLAGCAALLSPSFAEGFGLPLLEGIAMGVPTIASDIPSHREIAHATTVLLQPDDAAGWEAAIVAAVPAGSRRDLHIPAQMTEGAYAADILAFLTSLTPRAYTGDGHPSR